MSKYYIKIDAPKEKRFKFIKKLKKAWKNFYGEWTEEDQLKEDLGYEVK